MSKTGRAPYLFSDSSPGGRELLQSLTDGGAIFLFSYSPVLKSLTSWTKNAAEVLGVGDSAVARDGNLFLRHVHPDDRFLLMTDLESALQGAKPYRATYRWIRPDNNELRWIHCRASLFDREGAPSFEGLIMDVSHEMTGPLGAFSGPDSVGAILGAFPTMVLILDKDFRLLRINRPGGKGSFNFGDAEFKSEQLRIGRQFLECFAEDDLRRAYASGLGAVLMGESQNYRTRVNADKSVYNVEGVALRENEAIEGLLINVSDITELFELERKLADFRKSEGLRILASGVAHNFNNALQAIVGHAALAAGHPERTEIVKQAGESIMEIVERASGLARQLFASNESEQSTLSKTDLNLCAMAAVNRVDDIFASGLKLAASFGNPGSIMARPSQIVDAIEAIIRNAKESMDSRGTITVKTREVVLSEGEVEELPPGGYARIDIIDDGPGMDDETKAKCLDPFFTTKNVDTSTGLGLSGRGLGLPRAFNIVREAGGALTIDSELGRGAKVSLFLPLADAPATPAAAPKAAINLAAPKVLIVDDDPMVLRAVENMLEDEGYGVLTARDAAGAVAIVERHMAQVRLILLDLIIPGSDVLALLKKLKRLNPNVVVIGFSGAADSESAKLTAAGASCILNKPITTAALREAVGGFLGVQKIAANA